LLTIKRAQQSQQVIVGTQALQRNTQGTAGFSQSFDPLSQCIAMMAGGR